MSFLHPWMLAGLLAAAVPILLHLIQQREPPTVPFPAVRYLQDATREHQRRLRLRHWLLLLLRTLLVAALVLAAAGPSLPKASVASHAPTALVLVVDNSLSSAAVVDGTARLDLLVRAARGVLGRATPDDALWLLAADGVPRRGDAAALGRLLDDLRPSARRLDLGEAVRTGAAVLAADRRPGEIVIVSDAQATALGAADVSVPVTVARPAGAPPANVGVAALDVGAQPWPPEGGRASVRLDGDSTRQVPLQLQLGGRPARQALGAFGAPVTIALPAGAPGWQPLVASTEPDELRLDDRRVAAVRVAPVARASCGAGRHVAAACEVLRANGRLIDGDEIALGGFGTAGSILTPPADPAQLGALNRELERRGVAWRFGGPAARAGATDSGAVVGRVRVTRRHTLVPAGSGRTGVLATADGEPWLVRSGGVLLLGSRLEPEWTDLPLSAGFMPFLDRLLNRLARAELATVEGAPGAPVALPDLVREVVRGAERWTVEGGAPFRAPDTGLYALTSGRDTLGVLAVNPDPRESRLAPAGDDAVRALWPGARVVDLAEAGRAAFTAGARSDLRGPLLLLALLCGLGEVLLASAARRRRTA